ncbi:MAG: hypothetical protein Kow0037_30120 [Calditrichia bacterium]
MLTRLLEQKNGPEVLTGRCIRARLAENDCTVCETLCPFSAISTGNSVEIDGTKCTDCGLCAAGCPSSAIQNPRLSIGSVLGQLRKIPQPVLGCKTKSNSDSHVKVDCLGWLDAEKLLILEFGLTQPVQINCSPCHSCKNYPAIRQMVKTYNVLRESLPDGWQQVQIVAEKHELHFQPVVHTRREFFRNFRSVLIQEVRERVVNTENDGDVPYGEKSLPESRMLLNLVLDKQPDAVRSTLAERIFPRLKFTEACNGCGDCEAICPTPALNAEEPDMPPKFLPNQCLECGLCEPFCPENAIRFDHASLYQIKESSLEFVEPERKIGAI